MEKKDEKKETTYPTSYRSQAYFKRQGATTTTTTARGSTMNCTFCNAPKFKTTTLKLTGGKTQKTHFCEDCFDEMQASNARWIAKKDQERLASPAMGLTEISRRVQK